MILVEPDGEKNLGPCPDCGNATRSVWGYVSNAQGARAVYFIRWTEGHLDEDALAHPTCKEVFAILDRLVEDDPRFKTFLSSRTKRA
jgi:hypothetical protein